MLKLEAVNQYYGSSHILRNLSLQLEPGRCTVLLGRNGVGKTSLMKTLMGLEPIKTGTILLNQQDISRWPSHKRVAAGLAYVPQGREIFPRLTIEENLLMGQAIFTGPDASKVPEFVYDMFPVLFDMKKRRGGDLSGGQQQQLAIGRALVSKPKVLLLDEPTEGIQPSIIKDIGRVIQQLKRQGDMTILLVEQFYDFAAELADHYAVMARGEIIQQGYGTDMAKDGVKQLVAI
jgi:urea transport system ATP-binding protein